VMGGSGDYLDVADRVLAMVDYRPQEVTERAGQVVSGLVRRIVDARTLAVSDPPTMSDLLAKLKGAST